MARVVQKINAYGVLMGKREGKRPLGRPSRGSENNIKMDLQEIGRKGVKSTDLIQDRDRWQALMNKALDCRAPENLLNLSTSR